VHNDKARMHIHERIISMTETVMNTRILPEFLLEVITTDKVRVKEIDGEIRVIPFAEPIDYIEMLRGSLADYPELSVDKFLERKRADKELDR